MYKDKEGLESNMAHPYNHLAHSNPYDEKNLDTQSSLLSGSPHSYQIQVGFQFCGTLL